MYCHMKADIQGNFTAWIDEDGIPGLTDGDTAVYPGDQISLDVKVQLGNCQEW